MSRTRPVAAEDVVRRSEVRLAPDPSRVITRLFIAGEDLPSDTSRAAALLRRVLAIPTEAAPALLEGVLAAFGGRHEDLEATLQEHFLEVADRIAAPRHLSAAEQALIGAYFTSEYAIEGTALCNPSMVEHPDQSGLAAGTTRFVLSLRAIGEGHISSIEFRTGTVDKDGHIRLEVPTVSPRTGRMSAPPIDKARVERDLEARGDHGETAATLFALLPDPFTRDELERAIASLHRRTLSRQVARDTIERIRLVVSLEYDVDFGPETTIGDRVLVPRGPNETHGMEDARFVRFDPLEGAPSYLATYTAFDGDRISPQLISTRDFARFRISPLGGSAALNKGIALFPRPVDGRFLALSRSDGESNGLTASVDGRIWGAPRTLQGPARPWELVQIGNCGSPIETAEGWLVFTHGVGPMRSYAIGATLLDLEDPSIVRAGLDAPLLSANASERDGYVPNVVYSCGAMRHGDQIVLPYAFSDLVTSVAMIDTAGLLDLMLS